jgi:hypothetical protein
MEADGDIARHQADDRRNRNEREIVVCRKGMEG